MRIVLCCLVAEAAAYDNHTDLLGGLASVVLSLTEKSESAMRDKLLSGGSESFA